MECAECEWNVYHGHAPDCSRRCQNMHSDGDSLLQCEHLAKHKGPHAVYSPDEEDGITYSWPATLTPTSTGEEEKR